MSRFGEWQGYTGKPCINCGRYRVERYSSGFEICEKCHWCEQLSRYVPDDEFYEDHSCSNCKHYKDGKYDCGHCYTYDKWEEKDGN